MPTTAAPEPAQAADAAREAERPLHKRLLGCLLVLQAALLLNGAWRVGPTFDEHFYAAAGVAYWRDGALELNREHPPLLKLFAGLPLVLAGARYPEHALEARNFPVDFFYQRHARDLDRNLFLARLPFCALTLVTTVLIHRAARARFGLRAALGAAVLFALNPSVLAHGRLVSLDAGATPFFFGAVLAFEAALREPAWSKRLGAAVLFGLAHLAKFTALVLGPAFAVLALVAALRARSARPLATLALTLFGGLGVFALGYGFDARSINSAFGSEQFVRELPPRPVQAEDLAAALARAGAPDADVARLLERDLAGAVDLVLQGLQDPQRAPLAARALQSLEDGPGELRKRAFERVMELPDQRLAPATRDRTLSALSGCGAPDLAGWRAFFAETRGESWDRTILYHEGLEALTVDLLGHARAIPLLTALKGVDQTLAHGAFGHGSYFRGRTLLPGRDFAEGNPHPEYYAFALGVKNPLAWLALAAAGLALAVGPSGRRALGVLGLLACVGIPLGLFAAFSLGKALLGVRYLLPLYPFLALLGGQAFARFPRAAWTLAAVSLLEWAWIHPHELMFYNPAAGGPARGPAITVVGDDWGQDARAVGRFYGRYRGAIDAAGGLVYRPYTMADPAALGLAGVKPHMGPVHGIVAVHAVDYYREAQEFAWLRDYEPFLRLGWSVYLYDTRAGPPGADPRPAWEAGR